MNIKCCTHEFAILLSVFNTNVHQVEVAANAHLGYTPVHTVEYIFVPHSNLYKAAAFGKIKGCLKQVFWDNLQENQTIIT